ncbi:MAG: MTH1187 family thiamine-binding protein [Chlorobiales bacterium]|nr:MTH1187 family thiamine-binding protein [Chlorobiales bacterium]
MDKGISLSKYVSRAVRIVRESGLAHKLGPMGTVIEGEWDEVMKVVDACFKAVAEDSDRVSLSLKVDARKGSENRLESKIASVEKALQTGE